MTLLLIICGLGLISSMVSIFHFGMSKEFKWWEQCILVLGSMSALLIIMVFILIFAIEKL